MEWSNIVALVTRAQRGDREAYGELAKQFQATVYAMALSSLRDAHEAQELAQEVLVHAFIKLDQLREPAAFAGWLRQITARMVINRVTRRARAQAAEPKLLDATPARTPTPLDALIAGEQASRVRAGIERLGAMDRETLVAFYFRGKSLDQISRDVEAPVGTIKRRLHVARNRLRRQLESETAPALRGTSRRTLVGAGT
jgi:RNA polymerase sigma-70 factor (ECF subfamily)